MVTSSPLPAFARVSRENNGISLAMSPNVVVAAVLDPAVDLSLDGVDDGQRDRLAELSTVIATFALPVTLPPSAALTSGPITRSPDSSPEPLTS